MTEQEVQAAAKRARIAIDGADVAALTAALNDALARLEPLRHARIDIRGGAIGVGAGGMPLRADVGPPYAMARPARALAASSRAGYVLVPRLGGNAATDQLPARGDMPNGDARTGSPPDLLGDDALAAELELGA